MKTKFYFFLWVCLSALLVACEHEESDTSFKGTVRFLHILRRIIPLLHLLLWI